MDLLGHDFYLFLDARTNDFAVLYKRKDGDYGLLAPRRG
jgi:putative sigma-54 modulation protein